MAGEVQQVDLGRGAMLAAVTTLLASPRILLARGGPGPDPTPLMLALFPVSLALWSFVTTSEQCGSMVGVLPGRRRLLAGMGVAVLLSAVLIPFELTFDPRLRAALVAFEDKRLLSFSFPSTVRECLASIAWSMGLELLFFQAAALAFFARLTRRQDLAIGLAVLLRIFVVGLKLTMKPGLQDVAVAAFAHQLVLSAVTCVLYARAGLPAAMTLSALIDSRHLARVLF